VKTSEVVPPVSASSEPAGSEAADNRSQRRVLLVAPTPPPYGGMALQARLLERMLRSDGHSVSLLASNAPLPNQFMERLRGLRPFLRSMLFTVRLWKEAARADVIHVLAASWLYFLVVVTPAIVVGRLRGVNVVLNYRGGEAARFFRWFGWAVKPIFRLATAVTAPSVFLSHLIHRRFGVPVRIVPNIVDLSRFRYKTRTELRPRMVATRHLEKSYDIESVLKAFRAVQANNPDASLWIGGTGTQEEYLRTLATTWDLRNVRFLGHVDHVDLPAIYDQCDILLNASLVDNFPAALLEASAAGLVVVTTSAGGIPFIYENGKNALLAAPRDWQGLADAVEKVLRDPFLGREMAANAAELARQCEWRNVRQFLYRSYGFVPERELGFPPKPTGGEWQ
jgi:glycosyltransferase involved in cell wall biosynthesis